MSESNVTQTVVKEKSADSFFPYELQPVVKDHLRLPTWGILTFLVVTFILLKTFIYIPDEKRKNK